MVVSFRETATMCASRIFAAFADRISNFAGFAEANADSALLVAHHHQRAETETASAFHDFGGTVDEDDFLDQLSSPSFRLSKMVGVTRSPPGDRGLGRRDPAASLRRRRSRRRSRPTRLG